MDDDWDDESESDTEDDLDEGDDFEEEEESDIERLLMAIEDRLDELRDYADERELDEVLLLIPYCNPVYQGVSYLNELINPKASNNIDILLLNAVLFSLYISESPLYELQRQAKEYNIDQTSLDDTKESEEYQKLYPVFSKFCMLHDPFKDFNKIFLRLKDDDRAISWCYSPKEIEIKLGDIKQQLSLKK